MNRGKILESWRRKGSVKGGREGPDFIVVSNEDKLDLRGARGIAGLLPFGDANALSLEAARERVPKAGATPVLAGICATDPLRLMDKFLQEMKAVGVAGVQNAPSVGLIDGGFRTSLEDGKLGYGKEVGLVRLAEALDLITMMFVFSPEDAAGMAEAGADVVVVHPGFGAAPESKAVASIAAAARKAKKNILVFGFGRALEGMDGIQTE